MNWGRGEKVAPFWRAPSKALKILMIFLTKPLRGRLRLAGPPRLLLTGGGQAGIPAGREASWRSGYAEDCKSLHPGSIPGEASNKIKGLWAFDGCR